MYSKHSIRAIRSNLIAIVVKIMKMARLHCGGLYEIHMYILVEGRELVNVSLPFSLMLPISLSLSLFSLFSHGTWLNGVVVQTELRYAVARCEYTGSIHRSIES